MTKLPKEWENGPLVSHFMRHVVPIYFDLRKGAERHQIVFTAFVFSVYDQWLLMTAGHCITDMKQYREAGYSLTNCQLHDELGAGARYKLPIPFDYDAAEPTMLGVHHTWDYGVLFPSDNTRSLLEANGVLAFSERSWEPEVEQIETYRVLGIPATLTVADAERINITMLFPRVERLAQRPEGFEETEAPMFYGRLPASNPLRSLKGMSGGPVLAFAQSGERLSYWLCAMLVSQVGNDVSAMLMRPLGVFLKEFCEGKHRLRDQ